MIKILDIIPASVWAANVCDSRGCYSQKNVMDTITYRAHISRTEIGFLNSIIESYEGIGVVRTFDARAGIVELWIPAEFESLVTTVMHNIAEQIGLQYLYKAPQRLSD
jgi:hypothetical protein